MTTRTQDEVLARYEAADDFFGFARELLLGSMTADTIRRINPDADLPEDWQPTAPDALTTEAHDYLTFALDKAVSHRGISAERSTIKLREFAWLLGRDDVVAAMDAAEYPQYGMPKVKAFADGMRWPFTTETSWEQKALDQMAQGLLCTDDCAEGCGQ